MTTLQVKIKIKCDVSELAERIFEHRFVVFDDAVIQCVYYKNKDKLIVHGDSEENLKCFPKTLVFKCLTSYNKSFKIRLFYSKDLKTLHCASGLAVMNAKKYLIQLSKFMTMISMNERDVHVILVNAVAQIKYGINIENIIKKFERNSIRFSYTPKRNASLKLFSSTGTTCLHSTGKVLYMGAKSEAGVMELHSRLNQMCLDSIF